MVMVWKWMFCGPHMLNKRASISWYQQQNLWHQSIVFTHQDVIWRWRWRGARFTRYQCNISENVVSFKLENFANYVSLPDLITQQDIHYRVTTLDYWNLHIYVDIYILGYTNNLNAAFVWLFGNIFVCLSNISCPVQHLLWYQPYDILFRMNEGV